MTRGMSPLVWVVVTFGLLTGSDPLLKTAKTHPMQYYLTLPDHWTPERTWPIVVAIDGSGKDFLDMARLYTEARRDLPFIIVSPVVLTNGGTDLRHSSKYNYSPTVWDEVDRSGNCRFDLDGLAAVIADVRREYNGAKVYITGFSAGAHAMWAIVFQHPEYFAAAAPASGNYVGRCMTDDAFSKDTSRLRLPIREFLGDSEVGRGLDAQFARAKKAAADHGFGDVSLQTVPGDHDPHAEAVLAYFAALSR